MENASKTTSSRDDFVQGLRASGLFSPEEVELLLTEFPGGEGASLAHHLIATGKLTAYQAEAVREGKLAQLRIGNYDVLERLGAGGMGTVFKARHRRMKRVVALKVLTLAACTSETFLKRFEREVQVISGLNHPNIVMAHDAGESEVGPFLVMEYVNGRDLASEVQKRGPLPVREAVQAILHAARALEYAHAKGIIHRDVKPANLLRDSEGVVKVADLGLARCNEALGANSNSGLTQAGGIVGTLDYMPPEQAFDSTRIDHRADIYSLGYTLFYLLVGQPPYTGESFMAIFLKHRESPIPELATSRTDVPPDLEAIYRKMVAKKPEDRYQSMGDVVAALEGLDLSVLPFLPSGPAVVAMPDSPSTAVLAGATTRVVAPQPDSGTTVDLSLEKAARSEGPLLLVEPSRTQANIIRRMLQDLGADNVLLAPSGHKALEEMRSTRPRTVVCAMHLDDMTGAELLKKMRGDASLAAVGFVLIASPSDSSPELPPREQARMVLLPKPFDRDHLGQALTEAENAVAGCPGG